MEIRNFNKTDYPLQDETEIISITAIEIHKNLGAGFLEIVYKDAFEYEFEKDEVFTKEKKNTLLTIKTLFFHISFMQTLWFLKK